jgi:mRNA interferase RelE/StbE
VSHRIEYTPLALDQLRDLARHERRTVFDAVDKYLTDEPEKESKSRIKRLRGYSVPAYRLRIGDLRVYYTIERQSVTIHGIAPKDHQDEWLTTHGTP